MKTAAFVVGGLILVAVLIFFVGKKDVMTVDRILLIGKWISTQDAKFTRDFRTDGTVIDTYQGSSPESKGNWTLFTKAMPPDGFTGELEEKSVYLSIAAPQSEALHFKITKIDEHTLELVYLDRGGELSFTRVK